MNKNQIIETAKNIAKEASIKYVFASCDDPNRPALKQQKVKLARLLYVIRKISSLAKNENDKSNGYSKVKLR